jgi:radical SAM protein with 4Fe4S-binding SPASM domain
MTDSVSTTSTVPEIPARPPLTQLVLKPTVRCFHRCGYCDPRQVYYGDLVRSTRTRLPAAPQVKAGEMPLEVALSAVREAAALGMRSLQLSGGDPYLYAHLREVVEAGASHDDVFVFMNSVGTGVTRRSAADLMAAGLNAWNFSVDTLDPDLYDEIRGVHGAHEKIIRAIETVRAAAADYPRFNINYMAVITRANYRTLPRLVAHCIETGVTSLHLMNVYGDDVGDHLLGVDDIRIWREEVVPGVLEVVESHLLGDVVTDNALAVMATFFGWDNTDENFAEGLYWPSDAAVLRGCRTPTFYCLVEPDGRVLPCCLVEVAHEGEVGRMPQQSLTDIWNGTAYRAFRANRLPFCRRCSAPQHRTLGFIPELCRQFNNG